MKDELLQGHEIRLPFKMKARFRFVALLGAFVLFFVYGALAPTIGIDTRSPLARTLSTITFVVLFSAAALTVSASRATLLALRAFLLFVIVMVVVSRFADKNVFDVVSILSMASFVGWVCLLITRRVWGLRHADVDAIAAALCAFLMLGLLWTLLYALICHFDPLAFGGKDLSLNAREPLTPLYFSFVTLTTLGYGDISPVSPGARMCAILEAIVGQIFLVVLVARLVGLSMPSSPPDDQGTP